MLCRIAAIGALPTPCVLLDELLCMVLSRAGLSTTAATHVHLVSEYQNVVQCHTQHAIQREIENVQYLVSKRIHHVCPLMFTYPLDAGDEITDKQSKDGAAVDSTGVEDDDKKGGFYACVAAVVHLIADGCFGSMC